MLAATDRCMDGISLLTLTRRSLLAGGVIGGYCQKCRSVLSNLMLFS